jgi:hypothetical protein
VVVLGSLIHDASKAPWADRRTQRSHSSLMREDPEPVAAVSMALLGDAERRSGVALAPETRGHVHHVVLSHHGVYGKVHPRTPEARLVAACDHFSSTNHRLAPVDANDILPLLAEGYRWPEAAARLGFARELVKTRLREACDAEGVRAWTELLPIWRRTGRVATGGQAAEIARAKEVLQLARRLPDSLIERVATTIPRPVAV